MRWLGPAVLLGACASFPAGPRPAPPPPAAAPKIPDWPADVRVPPHLRRPPPAVEAAIARAVDDMIEGDFEARTSAGRRLVALGDLAVAYLGYARKSFADQERLRNRFTVVLETILAQSSPERVGRFLDSPYLPVRVAAALVCGERRLTQHAPHLVDLLDDAELEIRQAAVTALRMISREFYGYDAEDAPAEAIARWRALWPDG